MQLIMRWPDRIVATATSLCVVVVWGLNNYDDGIHAFDVVTQLTHSIRHARHVAQTSADRATHYSNIIRSSSCY